MSDAIEKYATHIRVSVLQKEIRTLRTELDTVKKERDEALWEIERMKIVAFIRDQPYQYSSGLAEIADAIERGDHREENDNE